MSTDSRLVFDEEKHHYYYDGRRVPGVTSILESVGLIEFGGIPIEILDSAAQRGTAVHKMLEFYDKGTLDESTVSDDLVGYLIQWKKFLNEMNVQIFENEKRLFSSKYFYAGTLDRVAEMNGKETILDIKTGVPWMSHPVQLSAYDLAYNEDRRRKMDRMCVYLKPDNFKLKSYKDRNDSDVFLGALNIFNFKRSYTS